MSNSLAVQKRFVDIDGIRMAYVESGRGDPIVFLHGNPTSSYLWRKVMPAFEDQGRLIAPDLVGHGDSEKLTESGPGRYRFVTHRAFLDALLQRLGVNQNVTLVVHDWGSALGFDWANRHRERIKALIYMEALVCPLESWEQWPADARNIFQALRSPAGEALILNKNIFVERILPSAVLRPLTDAEMAEYVRPFRQPGEGRRPTLTWPREIPVAGTPFDVHAVVSDYSEWLAQCAVPKLFVNADPGSILIGKQREYCRTWANQTEITVSGLHFIQEDAGPEIGAMAADWLRGLSGASEFDHRR